MTDAKSDQARQERAREWIRALTELPDRFAGTPVERAAAKRIGEWMSGLKARDVVLEPAPSGPRPGYVLALHAAVALLGLWVGGFLGVLLTAVALWSFRSDLRHGLPRLAKFLPSAESVNVCGRFGSSAPRRRVVLSAHIDSAQAGLLFAPSLADRFASLASRGRRSDTPPTGPLALPEAFLVAALVFATASWMGAHGFLFGLGFLIVEAGLALTIALTMQWAWSDPTPGANDNASAVAAMLTCAERLAPALPDDVELWMVGTGAEEVGCCGMHGFVDEHAAIVVPDHPFAARPFVTPADLAEERLLLYTSSPDDSFTIQQILRPAGVAPRRVSFVMLTEALLEMVKARLGVAVMQTWAVEPALRAGDVRAVPITAKGVHRQWSAATLVADGNVPYIDAFIDLLASRGMPARKRPLLARRRSGRRSRR